MMKITNKNERQALIVSVNCIFGNLLLSISKLIAGLLGQSGALISDAIHSASDVFSTLIVMAGIHVAHKAADNEHPYGHERLESVAAILLALVLALAALAIGWQGVEKIIAAKTEPLPIPGQLALWAALISIAIKEIMFRYTRSAAKKLNSDALLADAWHHRSDALSSIGSFVGVLGSRLGYPMLDPLASLLICLMIMHAAWEIFSDAVNKLVDRSADSDTENALKTLILRVPGVDHLDSLHSRVFGSRLYVDVEISVRDDLSLAEAHRIAEMTHRAIEANFPPVKHCMVHVNPLSEKEHETAPVLPPELLPNKKQQLAG